MYIYVYIYIYIYIYIYTYIPPPEKVNIDQERVLALPVKPRTELNALVFDCFCCEEAACNLLAYEYEHWQRQPRGLQIVDQKLGRLLSLLLC